MTPIATHAHQLRECEFLCWHTGETFQGPTWVVFSLWPEGVITVEELF